MTRQLDHSVSTALAKLYSKQEQLLRATLHQPRLSSPYWRGCSAWSHSSSIRMFFAGHQTQGPFPVSAHCPTRHGDTQVEDSAYGIGVMQNDFACENDSKAVHAFTIVSGAAVVRCQDAVPNLNSQTRVPIGCPLSYNMTATQYLKRLP